MPNARILEEKKAAVEALSDQMKNASAGVLVDYKGICVADDTSCAAICAPPASRMPWSKTHCCGLLCAI